MNSNFKITNPKGTNFTLTVTMSLEEWIKLQDQLNSTTYPGSHPACSIVRVIYDMVQQADKFFIPKKETKEN